MSHQFCWDTLQIPNRSVDSPSDPIRTTIEGDGNLQVIDGIEAKRGDATTFSAQQVGKSVNLTLTGEYVPCINIASMTIDVVSTIIDIADNKYGGPLLRSLGRLVVGKQLTTILEGIVNVGQYLDKAGPLARPLKLSLRAIPFVGAVLTILEVGSTVLWGLKEILNELEGTELQSWSYTDENGEYHEGTGTVGALVDLALIGTVGTLIAVDFVDPCIGLGIDSLFGYPLNARTTAVWSVNPSGTTRLVQQPDGPFGPLVGLSLLGDTTPSDWHAESNTTESDIRSCDFTRLQPSDQPVPGVMVDEYPALPCDNPARRT